MCIGLRFKTPGARARATGRGKEPRGQLARPERGQGVGGILGAEEGWLEACLRKSMQPAKFTLTEESGEAGLTTRPWTPGPGQRRGPGCACAQASRPRLSFLPSCSASPRKPRAPVSRATRQSQEAARLALQRQPRGAGNRPAAAAPHSRKSPPCPSRACC